MASEQEEFEQLKEEYVTTFRQMNSLQQKVVTLEQQLGQARALLEEVLGTDELAWESAHVWKKIHAFLGKEDE